MTKDEALKLAFEALKGSQHRFGEYGYQAMETTMLANNKAIAALEEVLAQPAQKPVAHIRAHDLEVLQSYSEQCHSVLYRKPAKTRIPLYTALPQRPWVGFTDGEIKKLSDDCVGVRDETEFIRAIAQALKEKNT